MHSTQHMYSMHVQVCSLVGLPLRLKAHLLTAWVFCTLCSMSADALRLTLAIFLYLLQASSSVLQEYNQN